MIPLLLAAVYDCWPGKLVAGVLFPFDLDTLTYPILLVCLIFIANCHDLNLLLSTVTYAMIGTD